jgi:uncharacterized repeat protein (TIGR01451 family)
MLERHPASTNARRWRRRWVGAGVLVAVAGAGVAHPAPAAAAPQPYLLESFTGATTPPGFVGVGTACLTGAPQGTVQAGIPGCPAAGTAPVPPMGGAPYGFLQLNSLDADPAADNQRGAVLYNQPIAASAGLSVSFEQWQYGSTTAGPADGIAFFLVDGTTDLTAPGAFGGSLGYAQKQQGTVADPGPWFEGMHGGYLGIGLDVLGNFFDDSEDRGFGCDTQASPSGAAHRDFRLSPPPEREKVTVRGPGRRNASGWYEGYCFVDSTSLAGAPSAWPSGLPAGSLRGDPTPGAVPLPQETPAVAATRLQPAKRTVAIDITPAPNPVVTVSLGGADGVLHQKLSFPAPTPMPATYKFGFSASTGEWNDVHLIRNLAITANPALDLTMTADSPGPYAAGDTVHYTYLATNRGTVPITGLVVGDDKVPSVTCASTTLVPESDMSTDDETTCTGTYVVTAADVAAGLVHNTAVASADGGVASSPASATVTVTGPVPPPPAVAAETLTAGESPPAEAVAVSPSYAG